MVRLLAVAAPVPELLRVPGLVVEAFVAVAVLEAAAVLAAVAPVGDSQMIVVEGAGEGAAAHQPQLGCLWGR